MAAVNARWIVPVAVTAVVVGGGVAASAASDATPDLPERTAQDLLLAIDGAEPTPFSGTVRTVADLGLPALGDLTGGGPSAGATDPASALTRLLSGENELRVWVGGPDQQRVSLLDDFAELDVVRDGDELWTYSSSDDTATFYDLPAIAERAERAHLAAHDGEEPADEAPSAPTPYDDMTPGELASSLLDAADETTEVAVGETQVVAGRDAYTLTATPRDEATLVGRVAVAVDAATGIVLQVEVGARDQSAPAYVTGFTSLDLSAPDAGVFDFTPAPGTTVVDALVEADAAAAEAAASGERDAREQELDGLRDDAAPVEAPEPVVHGEGWSSAVELQLPAEALATAEEAAARAESTMTDGTTDGQETDEQLGPRPEQDVDPLMLLEQLTTEVPGGRVLTTALVTVLLTDDGRVLVGAVDAATLQSYAG